jgi:circadian clock protein KaiB
MRAKRKSSKVRPRARARRSPCRDSTNQITKRLNGTSSLAHYSLRLYITGNTARSTEALANIRSLCEEFLPGRYDLEVVDIYQHPIEAISEQIIAAPTLIKHAPKPLKRLIGNLCNRDKVLIGLDLGSMVRGTCSPSP